MLPAITLPIDVLAALVIPLIALAYGIGKYVGTAKTWAAFGRVLDGGTLFYDNAEIPFGSIADRMRAEECVYPAGHPLGPVNEIEPPPPRYERW